MVLNDLFGENGLDTTAFVDHLTESLYIWNKECLTVGQSHLILFGETRVMNLERLFPSPKNDCITLFCTCSKHLYSLRPHTCALCSIILNTKDI